MHNFSLSNFNGKHHSAVRGVLVENKLIFQPECKSQARSNLCENLAEGEGDESVLVASWGKHQVGDDGQHLGEDIGGKQYY